VAGAALAASAELTDLLDQVVAEGGRCRDLAIGRGLWNVVGGTERERLQADFRVAARQRRRHDDDEVALLLQELGKRGQSIDIRHLDVEDDDVRIDTGELIDRLAAGAQRRDRLETGFFVDPARDQTADNDRVVDDHHTDRILRRRGHGRRKGGGDAHTIYSTTVTQPQP
jgi:hypothetical protein